jgi:hypothetical protein
MAISQIKFKCIQYSLFWKGFMLLIYSCSNHKSS